MKKLALALCISLSLSACAPNYVKVTRLDAEGQYIPFVTAKTGGCLVEKKGNIDGMVVEWKDQDGTCVVRVEK